MAEARRPAPAAVLRPAAVAAVVAVLAMPALAQQGATRSGVSIVPTLSLQQLFTDSHLAQGSAATDGRTSESITTVSPGIRLASPSGRIQGSLDYSLVGVLYGRDSAASNVQHRLAASGRAEIVRNTFEINAAASISRQPTSALAVQSVDGALTERNQSDLKTVSLRPVLRGQLGGSVDLQASVNASATSGGLQGGTRGTGGAFSLASSSSGAVFGWGVDASRQSSHFGDGRDTTTDRVIGSLRYRPDPELQFTLRAGQERTDLASLESRSFDNYGGGITWVPSSRTRVQFDADKRQFGHSHEVRLEHRMRRTVVRYSDSRNVNDGSTPGAAGASVRAYDLFFELFASQEPDPVARDLLVRAFLERNGIAADSLLGGGGFLTGAVSIQRRRELSFAVDGLRTTWMLSAFQTNTERGDTVSGAVDDLAAGAIRQRGLSVTVSHRLTPVSSLNLNATTQRTRSAATGTGNGLDSVSLGWSTRLGQRSTFVLTLRHAEYDDSVAPYAENALSAAFTTRF